MHAGALSMLIRVTLIAVGSWAFAGLALRSPSFGTEIRPIL